MRALLIGLMVLATTPAFAQVQVQDVQSVVIELLEQGRQISVTCDTRITTWSQKATSIASTFGGDLSTADKAKLNGIKADIEAIGTACGALTATIDTDYPSIKE